MKMYSTLIGLVTIMVLAVAAHGQPMTFSVDFQGPSGGGAGPGNGLPDGFGITRIDEGSILTPARPGQPGPNGPLPGPLPSPGVMLGSMTGMPGSVPGGVGVVPGIGQAVEVDAISYGRDAGDTLVFSVDEFATGMMMGPAPNVRSEGTVGAREASADVFTYLGPVAQAPPGPTYGNTLHIDGDGTAPGGYPGIGLREPNPPSPGFLPDDGDNLDALDVNTTLRDVQNVLFLSLDARYSDSREPGSLVNTGTALPNGFRGGDVLWTTPGGPLQMYAPASTLGLDYYGTDTDDLDALVLIDDGDMRFTHGVDFILFSVRRGSQVIGRPDSMFGRPISESDVLTARLPGGSSPFPALYIPGHAMGLYDYSHPGGAYGPRDELDALDVVPEPGSVLLLALGSFVILRRSRA